MLELTLADSGGGEIADVYPKLAKLAVGTVLFVVFVVVGMSRKAVERDGGEFIKAMTVEHRDKARSDAPSQVRKWMWCMLALTLYLMGRQAFQVIQHPEVWPDRLATAAMYGLFMLVPAVATLVLLPRPAEAPPRRLQLGIKLMQGSALLLVLWAVAFFVMGQGYWLGGVWFLVVALTPFLTGGLLSQIKAIRQFDASAPDREADAEPVLDHRL